MAKPVFGGSVVPGGADGGDCLFDFIPSLSASVLGPAIADGTVAVILTHGPNVGSFGQGDGAPLILGYAGAAAAAPSRASAAVLWVSLGGLALLRRRG